MRQSASNVQSAQVLVTLDSKGRVEVMGLRIIEGTYDGDTSGAVMICSTTMWAFGPVFDDPQEIDCFQDWWGDNYSESIREASESQLKERFELFRRLVVRCRDCDEWTVAGGGVCEECWN